MANTCKFCGKKFGFMTGSNKLSDEYNELICDECFYKFKTKINILEHSKNSYKVEINKEDAIRTVSQCDFSDESKQYVISYIHFLSRKILDKTKEDIKLENEDIQKREEEAKIKLQLKEKVKTHALTTGYNFEGYNIISYLGVVSGSVVLGTGFLSEFGASISDLFGTQSDMFSEKLETARELALDNLKQKSVQLGGNALLGIDFDYITFSNNMIGVVANGTSVVIEKI